jgi:carbonic anhydrase
MLKTLPILALAAGFILSAQAPAAKASPNPDQALSMLMDGNSHFVDGKITHLSYITEAKDKMLEKQIPFACIIGCSDSRVPPELIFDRGLGELFVIRDAGNVIGPIEMDSANFAVAKLHVPIVMVLGHQNCGAVNATLSGQINVPELGNIYPLIESALKNCETIGSDKLKSSIYCNVRKGVETLRNSPAIAPILAQNKVRIVGGYFDIASGKVLLIHE